MITEIKEKETKKFLADHLWCDKSKFELLEPINIDDNIEITGKVAIYPKALYNSHVRNKFDYYIDFKSEDVKKIEKENNDLKVTFYTDICKSRVIQGHKFKLHHLENIYKILISKKYSYIRFIKDMIKFMFLNNPNYEMVLVINTKGSMYIKKINYNKSRYIKSNELMLCKIGKNVLRFGKVYSDYADVLESQGLNEGPSIIIEKWDILSKNNKNKIRIVNENLDDIIKPYLKFMEILKASLALEIEYNSKKSIK